MKKVILTKGLPGSGKTTWAKQLQTSEPGMYKRINKDDIRAMLDNKKWSHSNEDFVILVRDCLIKMSLEAGKNVIIDDTNLSLKHFNHIKELVKGMAEIEIKDFTNVPIETCIKRDLQRADSVGEKVIKSMYNQFLRPVPEIIQYNPNLSSAVICDLDGTFALLNGRDPYNASTCEKDLVNQAVLTILHRFQDEHIHIIFVSGREDKYATETFNWLESTGIKYTQLLMRKTGDMRKDSIVKKEIYNTYIKDHYNVLFVLDDRNQVVEMWRSLGLTCLQVAEGDF